MRKTEKDEATKEMKRVYALNNNKMPKIKEWKKLSSMYAGVITRIFGSWENAWEKTMGIKQKEPLYKKREEIIVDLQEAFSKNKDITRIGKLIRASGHTRPTIIKYFDSAQHALAMARIDLKKRITKDDYIKDFLSVYNKLKRIPTDKEIRNMCKYSITSYRNRFGSIDNLIKVAGLERKDEKRKTSKEELLEELRTLYSILRRVPKTNDIEKMSKYGSTIYYRTFGNLTNALNKIGLKTAVSEKVEKTCEHCGIKSKTIISHMKITHPKKLEEHEMFVVELFKNGLSSRMLAARDDVLYNGLGVVNRVIRKHLSTEEIEELRRQKIKNTLKNDYASGKYDWVNDLNRARSSSSEYRKKNSDGLKKAYRTGERKSWNKGLTKETDERIKVAAINTAKSIKSLYESGEIEKKFGKDSNKWNPNRDEVARRYRLGLGFNAIERRNIKKRAEYKCEKCEITQEELEENGKYLECDHIIPIFNGGLKDWDKNGQALCLDCHKNKSNKEQEQIMKTLDDCLKTYKTSWDDSVPLKFPKTKNISNKINAPPSEKLIWKGHELTRDFFSQCTPNERDEIAKDIFNYLMECDLTNYRVPIEEVKKDLKQLRQKTLKTEVKDGKTYLPNIVSTGNKAYRYFFPNLMKLKNGKKASVYDCLNDPKILWKIIRNRVGNTMLYSHDDSTPRQYPFTLTTLNMFIQGAKSTGYASHGSQFKPLLAKAIYDAHVKDSDNVLDYSAGYGARLLGLWATGKKCRYYAYEPCTETYNGLVALAKYLGFPVKLKKSGSEDSVFNAKMDFIFSSPPYYDVEHYTDEPSQSANKFPKYDDFLEGYWRETVKNIKKMMKPDAIFAINVGNGANKKMIQLTHDFKRIIEEEGFSLVNEWVMKTSKSHLSGKRGKSKVIKEEGIYFYRLS